MPEAIRKLLSSVLKHFLLVTTTHSSLCVLCVGWVETEGTGLWRIVRTNWQNATPKDDHKKKKTHAMCNVSVIPVAGAGLAQFLLSAS
jgi:hypothetical protein